MSKITVKHYLNTDVKPIIGKRGKYLEDLLNESPFDHREEEEFYPLYFRLTIKRKTTKLKSRITYYYHSKSFNVKDIIYVYPPRTSWWKPLSYDVRHSLFTKEEYNRLLEENSDFQNMLEQEKLVLNDLGNRFNFTEKKNFEIKSITDPYEYYIKSIWSLVNQVAIQEFKIDIMKNEQYKDLAYLFNTNISFLKLYKMLDGISHNKRNKTPFNTYLHKNFSDLKLIMEFFEHYLDNTFISYHHWIKNNHILKFKIFIEEQLENDELDKKDFLRIINSHFFTTILRYPAEFAYSDVTESYLISHTYEHQLNIHKA